MTTKAQTTNRLNKLVFKSAIQRLSRFQSEMRRAGQDATIDYDTITDAAYNARDLVVEDRFVGLEDMQSVEHDLCLEYGVPISDIR